MERTIEEPSTYESIADAVKGCEPGGNVCCLSEATFSLAKVVLVKEKISNITIQLLDSDGYAIRQVTSKKRSAQQQEHLNDRQIAVIKALEKVLMHCKKEGVQLIGYSDELVALPASIPEENISSASALDINTYDSYRGADAILDIDTD